MRVAALELDALPPHLSAAYDYWLSVKGDRIAPAWSEFELMQLPSVVLPSTMVVDVADPQENSTFRFWGSKMTEIHGVDMTGKCP